MSQASWRTLRERLYYMDIVAAVIGFALAGAVIALDDARWRSVGGLAFGAFMVMAGLMGLSRGRAYRQPKPWLVGAFTASAHAAAVIILWRLNSILFLVVFAAISTLLVIGCVLRCKRISDPISPHDVATFLILVVSVSLAIALCEVALRAGEGLLPSEVMQSIRNDPRTYGVAHPYIGHLQTPHHSFRISSGRDFDVVHHTGEFGFRNSGAWPAQTDVVVLGDSVTFGYGVEDGKAWPALIGHTLAPAQVLNLGLIGGGPQQYMRVYQTFGAERRPKLVVVGFFNGNDFANAGDFDRWLKSQVGGNYMVWRDFGRPNYVPFSLRHFAASMESFALTTVYPVLRRSHLYNLALLAVSSTSGRGIGDSTSFTSPGGYNIRLDVADQDAAAALARPGQPEFHLALDALLGIRTIAKRYGAHTLIVLQPAKEDVYLPLLGMDTPDVSAALREALENEGVEYLDLTAVFRQRAAHGARLFFELDGHPNETGYALIAESVGTHIRQNAARYGLN